MTLGANTSACLKLSTHVEMTRTAQTGPSPLGQDVAVATRIADVRRACEINRWPDGCVADTTALRTVIVG